MFDQNLLGPLGQNVQLWDISHKLEKFELLSKKLVRKLEKLTIGRSGRVVSDSKLSNSSSECLT